MGLIVILSWHDSILFPQCCSQTRLLTFHSFSFFSIPLFQNIQSRLFNSISFHSFLLLKYIPFHSVPFHSLMIIPFHSIPFPSLMNSQTEPETKGRGNDRNSNRGRSKSRNSNRSRSKSRSGQQVQCWNCGKTGHFRRQYKVLRRRMKMILLML